MAERRIKKAWSPVELIDTHCHLDSKQFFSDWQELLAMAHAAGVVQLVLPGISAAGWPRIIALAQEMPGLYAAPGIHPLFLSSQHNDDLDQLATLAEEAKVVAIGEIGLDYFDASCNRAGQQQLFEAQLDIAAAFSLPVLLHVRKAHDQVLATLRSKKFCCGGIVHAFNGSMQQAMQYIHLGFKIGFGGAVTFARALKIRHLAMELPLSSLVVETDAPDMRPADCFAKRNQPVNLITVITTLSELREIPFEEIARATTANACGILRLSS